MIFPFTRDQYLHELVERTGPVCLVRRVSTHPMSAGSEHWEVVLLRYREERAMPGGQIVAAGDTYPSGGQWGDRGWTYTDLQEARQKYHDLVRHQAQTGGSPPEASP